MQKFPLKKYTFLEFFYYVRITKDGKRNKFNGKKVNIWMQCNISAAQLKSQLIPCLQQFDTCMDSTYTWARLPCLVGWIYCGHNKFVHRKLASRIIIDKMVEMYHRKGKDTLTAKLSDQQK